MQKIKLIFALLIGIALAIFALENMATIQVSFLGQDFTTRRFILIGVSVLFGFLLGQVIRLVGHKKPKKDRGSKPDREQKKADA